MLVLTVSAGSGLQPAQGPAEGIWGCGVEDGVGKRGEGGLLTARERGGDQGQQLVPDVRPTRGSPEVEVGVDELLQTEMLGERGRQQQPRVGTRPRRRPFQAGRGYAEVLPVPGRWAVHTPSSQQRGTLPAAESGRGFGGSGLSHRWNPDARVAAVPSAASRRASSATGQPPSPATPRRNGPRPDQARLREVPTRLARHV